MLLRAVPWVINVGLVLTGVGIGLRCAWLTATSELWLIVGVAGAAMVIGAELVAVRLTGRLSE